MQPAKFFTLILLMIHLCAQTDEAQTVTYNRDVLPILADHCFSCHGFDEASRESDLRLDIRNDHALELLAPGDVESSEVISRVDSQDPDMVMPPPSTKKPLSESQKQILKKWIAAGATYETHWAFRRPRMIQPPVIAGVQHPIDRFIVHRLQRKKIAPAPRAPLTTLIRRVSLDLTGIPPTNAEVEQFQIAANEDFQKAWSQLVDRLLASPHYGEKWGRWWLDQARYADSNGYSIDGPRTIWKYRDWVIEALNQDMPFDDFTVEQLAGDLLPSATQSQLIATGFHRNTQINQEGGIDREQFRIDSVFDRVSTTGTVWLGLTIGCAQCHDHKFDPISQKEFYQLFAFFNNQDEPSLKVYDESVDVAATRINIRRLKSELSQLIKENQDSLVDWEKQLTDKAKKKFPGLVRKALAANPAKRNFDQQYAILDASPISKDAIVRKTIESFKTFKNVLDRSPTTMILRERTVPRTTHVFIKGDFTRKADVVTPSTPKVLHKFESTNQPTRLDLAKWLIRNDNPLTSRVIVNRIWQQYFGRGIVATENDFGITGSQPTHPELLDWLANRFTRSQWRMKSVHRLIVTSQTYQQASDVRTELAEVDADNLLLARQTRLRLDAELVRDVALVASGLFVDQIGGPPVFPPIADGVMGQGQVRRGWKTSKGEDRYRRGMYTFIYRATPPPSLNVFDAPDGFSTCTRRTRSNTPLQSLTLMNDRAFFEFAQALEKIIQDDGIEVAFQRCTSRLPDKTELEILSRLDTITAARAMLNLDETITRE